MDPVRLKRLDGETAKYGDLTAFNLDLVAEGLDIIKTLHEQNAGAETVEKRVGEYKSWDPEIFRVDKDVEDMFRKRLAELSVPVTLLSEEAGRVDIQTEKTGKPLIAVADPFDGSYLFKRAIPDFWYSSLAFFDEGLNPLSCAVGDGLHRDIAFANPEAAFFGTLSGNRISKVFRLNRAFRKSAGRDDITEIKQASIASYAMKPKKFMFPLVDEYRRVFEPFKFFLPNGGPFGFADVATGKIDVYFALRQPFVDVFSGLMVAEKADVVISDFSGRPVKRTDNHKSVHDVLCSTNQVLHDKVLKLINP